jgi:hypothetical protein
MAIQAIAESLGNGIVARIARIESARAHFHTTRLISYPRQTLARIFSAAGTNHRRGF